jgi:c-di-GMP-related signal transduction protein
VATILSDEFLAFDENLSPSMKSSIVLELQLVDIFSDVKAFILARTFAQYRGYKLCIDAITPDKLKYLNKEHFKVDFIKVIWNNSFIDVIRDDGVFNNMSADEKERIIICRVDNQEPIEVGNAMGIHLYQGRYVQRVLANRPKRTIYNIKR